MTFDTSTNFIKDAVIDHVLKDLGLQLKDLLSYDEKSWDMFEILCIAKADMIRNPHLRGVS